MKAGLRFVFIGAGFFLPCQGCILELPLRERVELVMPAVPDYAVQKFGVPSFLVSYRDPGGEVEAIMVPAGAPSVDISLPVKPVLPLLARPVFGGDETVLLPAGALYPAGGGSGKSLSLTWENGFAAELLLRMEAAGFPLDKFNAPRFFREAHTRGEGNPWNLDEEKIVAELQGLSFRADRIKLKNTFPVSLPVSGEVWFSHNVLTSPPVEKEGETVDFGYLPAGYHRYYPRGREGGKLDVYIKEGGSILYTVSGNG
jgi:hypothetical protein